MDEWGKITINEGELFQHSMEQVGELLIRLNKEQLSSGIDSKGKRLPGYSRRHTIARRKRGLQTSVKDLNYEGGHYAGFYSRAYSDNVEVGSDDPKSPILESADWSSPYIYGLTDENLEKFISVFSEVFAENFKNMILET